MKRVLLVVGGQKLTDPFDGTVNILARATQSLSRFDLDFSGRSVGSVTVNGAPASFRRDGQELIITPRQGDLRHPLRRPGAVHGDRQGRAGAQTQRALSTPATRP